MSGFEIDERVQALTSEVSHPLLFASLSGAHLYGFPSHDSDWDVRGAHVLPVRDVIGLNEPPDTIEIMRDDDGVELDLVSYDVKKFFGLLLKRNGNVLEQLYSPHVLFTTPEHLELREIATECVTRHHFHHYRGMSQNRWKAFAESEDKEAKPLLYAFRALLTGLHLLRTSEVEADINKLNDVYRLPFIPDLVDVKRSGSEHALVGTSILRFVERQFELLTEQLEQAYESSELRDAPTENARAALDELLVRLRLDEKADSFLL